MDKRWILILIIIILAVCCGYYVASTSDSVGNALADINKSTVTVPLGFTIGETTTESTELIKKNQPEKILIKDYGKKDIALDKYNQKYKALAKDDNIEILDNTTDANDNFKVYTIHYQNNSDNKGYNQSVSYLYTYDHTFVIEQRGFTDVNEMKDTLSFVVNTLKPDYKKSQE